MTEQPTSTVVDGAALALFSAKIDAIVRKMANTLLRTGRSGILNTARDFSCCILSGQGELLTAAQSLPIHVMSGPELIVRWLKQLHPTLERGDAFLHNSPYHGNSHAADYCLLVPVFDDENKHRFTVLAKAHQADCGNSVPTTYMASARDVYEEGALILPMVKAQTAYCDVDDIIRLCKTRIRVPDQWYGDYLALVAAARIGERELTELAHEQSWDYLDSAAQRWLDYSEARMITTLTQLPPGSLTTTGAHDPFPGVPAGIPITVNIHVDPEHARVEIDLRDNPDCQPCGLNLTEATARTAALVGVFNSIGGHVPANAGSLRRIHVHLRENCVVGIPIHPTSCSVATTNLADRVTNCVQRAFAELADGYGMAEAGLGGTPSVADISGQDPRRGSRPFVNEILLVTTSGAAGPRTDGWLTLVHVGNGGMMLHDSIELDELRFPIRITRQEIAADTEGAGRLRGAPGAYVEFGPVDCDLRVIYASDGTTNPAAGARDGLPGAPARQYRRDISGNLHELPACAEVTLQNGETIISICGGGGGYGRPTERERHLVLRDVEEGLITAKRAATVYGTRV
jgi:N-methylhydantoinase B